MKYQKILYATDFSPASDAALQYATALARDSGAKLLLVHVEELGTAYAVGDMVLPETTFPNPEVRKLLESILPPDKSVRYEHRLELGSPSEEIVRVANEEKVDLIVMGTHGRTGVTRVLMGSVAELVMRHATCPVLTLKQGTKAPSTSN